MGRRGCGRAGFSGEGRLELRSCPAMGANAIALPSGIVVMTDGMVELAEKNELFAKPLHPYTQALLSSIPVPDPVAEVKRTSIALEGEIPSPIFPPPGCRFHPRCKRKENICSESTPVWKEAAPKHYVACHLV